jgi:hypothetical protein
MRRVIAYFGTVLFTLIVCASAILGVLGATVLFALLK